MVDEKIHTTSEEDSTRASLPDRWSARDAATTLKLMLFKALNKSSRQSLISKNLNNAEKKKLGSPRISLPRKRVRGGKQMYNFHKTWPDV